MKKTLQTVSMKPNPAGKDRTKTGVSETQLGAEWADIKNTGSYNVDLAGTNLYHKAYKVDGSWDWQLVKTLTGVLKSGEILRVHSGKGPLSILRADDQSGAHYHTFVGESRYIWNNDHGDTAGLWQPTTKEWDDEASYDPNPPEGVILVRVGSKLVAQVAAYARR